MQREYLRVMDSGEFAEVSEEFRNFSSKMKDPLVVGALLHKLAEERQSSNLLLKEINAKLDKIDVFEKRITELEGKLAASTATAADNLVENKEKKMLLPAVDDAIVAFTREKGAVCAEDVQAQFKYKGKNAASARLNKLCTLGIVKKTQVGKKVYFEAVVSEK